MTNATSSVLRDFFASHDFHYLTQTIWVLAVALLLIVFSEREILRATSPKDQRRNVSAFTIIVAPTLVVFVMIIVARFVTLAQ